MQLSVEDCVGEYGGLEADVPGHHIDGLRGSESRHRCACGTAEDLALHFRPVEGVGVYASAEEPSNSRCNGVAHRGTS